MQKLVSKLDKMTGNDQITQRARTKLLTGFETNRFKQSNLKFSLRIQFMRTCS